MILYIAIEVSTRELSSQLLLAMVAASRGHQVLLGSANDLLLSKRLNLLPPGPYLVKNMNIPAVSQRVYEMFLNSGFELYCHEQEPPILWSDFNAFLDESRIKFSQFMPFKGVFCWGERDHDEYTKVFSDRPNLFHVTGSPRVDLWRPELRTLWQRNYVQDMKPYVLYVSNNGFSVGKRHWTDWIEEARKLELVNSEKLESRYYQTVQKDVLMVKSAVFSLRELAAKHRDVNFIVRPHPLDNESYWRSALGKHENIHVIYRDSLTPWIAGAEAIIHNSCTSALEATMQGVPVISFVPSAICDVLDVPNKLGVRVISQQELASAVSQVLGGDVNKAMSSESRAILRPLLAVDKELASTKIVKMIETLTKTNGSANISGLKFMKIRLALRTKALIDKARGVSSHSAAHSFNKEEVRAQVCQLAKIIGIAEPNIGFVSNSTILIG